MPFTFEVGQKYLFRAPYTDKRKIGYEPLFEVYDGMILTANHVRGYIFPEHGGKAVIARFEELTNGDYFWETVWEITDHRIIAHGQEGLEGSEVLIPMNSFCFSTRPVEI